MKDEKKVSIVIPTLQKRVDILEKLVKILSEDEAVGEIIIIDNSTKGLIFNYDKMRVIIPKTNIFVNPAWNLGVKESVNEYVGLLNDDIIVPENMCSDILKAFTNNSNIGALAFHVSEILPIEDIIDIPNKNNFTFSKADFVAGGYGIATFFRKDIYKPIPESIKIWFGDNYIFKQIENAGYENYWIYGQKIYHLGSLSCGEFKAGALYKADKKAWNKIKYKWYDYIFKLEEYADCIKLRILGANLRIFTKKTEKKILK